MGPSAIFTFIKGFDPYGQAKKPLAVKINVTAVWRWLKDKKWKKKSVTKKRHAKKLL